MDICFICKSAKKDDILYGEFLKNKDFGVHTFCLYLSSNLRQAGTDDKGFLGFLPNDIKTEVRRISYLKCCYCQQKYANIGCCKVQCRRTFHLICGIENKVEYRFCKDFRSYCHQHARREVQRPSSTETCLICFDSLCAPGKKFNSIEMILTPCCSNGWFHKLCLQKFANTAGYFFKCPLCNDDKVFREQLPAKGIFIPNQDAAWELEPNAFAELLERPNTCAAQRCKNKRGRSAESENNPFVMCHTCGSTAIHKLCLSKGGRNFNCADCSVALEERDSGRESLNSYVHQNEDEYIDVCHISDKEDVEIINRIIASSETVTEENKRDSGMHNDANISDEEPTHAAEKYRQANCSEAEKSSNDVDNDDVRPWTSKASSRLRIGSESSDTQQELKSSCRKTRFVSETESTSGEDIIYQRKVNNRRVSDESQQSNNCKSEKHKVVKRKSSNVFSDSDNIDTELVNANSSQSIAKSRYSESSDQEEIRTVNRKRKGQTILSDSDNELHAPKQTCLSSENIDKHVQCSSYSLTNLADESSVESDSDPLEYFYEIIEKRNKRKITPSTKRPDAKNEQKRKRKLNENSNSNKQNYLEVSSIATRTRRKTICIESNAKIMEKKNSQDENPFNTSCIALRTRRKTICGRTEFDEQIKHEISQTYEKLHESDESYIHSTDHDDRSETKSSSENFILDDGYEESDSKFEISCIANRTRRRKSLKSRCLPKIDEVPDCSTDSSNASESLSQIRRCRRVGNRRSYFSSSEKSDSLPNTRSLKVEKFPVQNFASALKTADNKKTESLNSKSVFSYHPSNPHHPHNINRRRI